MKSILAGFLFASFFSISGVFPAQGADTSPPPRLTVDLRDGSRIIGTSVEKSLSYRDTRLGTARFRLLKSRRFARRKTTANL
jgi:hypothetical protein